MEMEMAQPLNNQKSKTFLFLGLLLRPHSLKTRGNANNSSFENVTRLWKQSQLKEALNILYVGNQCVGSHTYAWLLQDCITKKALFDGKLVHAHIIQNGFKWEEIIVGNSLATIYAKCGNMVDARRVLDLMPERDVVSWTAMIAAYARNGFAEDALTLFYQMQLTGIQPNQFTFASVLPACVNSAVLKGVHEEIIKSGLQFNVFVGNALVDVYAKAGNVENARDLFDKMPQRNVVSWNSMIAGYAQKGQVDEAMKLFQKMPERNVVSWTTVIAGYAQNGFGEEAQKLFRQMQMAYVKPNSKTFAIVLPACASLAALKHGEEIHGHIIRSGILSDVYVESALLDMYAKCGSIDCARKLFDKMPQRDAVSWNTMILGYAQNGHVDEALKLFHKIPQRNVVSWTTMIAGYAQNGHVDESLKLFHEMPERNVVSWNAMIAGYGQNGQGEEALKLFQQMQLTGVKPNSNTFATLIPACASLATLKHGKEVHAVVIRSGFQSDVFVGSALVDMYAKCRSIENACTVFEKMPQRNVVSWNAMIAGYAQNEYVDEAVDIFQKMPERNVVSWTTMITGYTQNGCVDEALKLFQEMPERSVVSWNAMIAGYAQNGHVEDALKLYQQMQLAGVRPNSKTFASVLSACANFGTLEYGKELHEGIIRSGSQSDIVVGNALVDMYAKCGCIKNARYLFDRMPNRDVVSWNAMIAGYAQNGYIDESLDLFQKIPEKNVVSWTAMIAGCAQSGHVDRAMELFQKMPERNTISWNAMIAGYARNGHVGQALKLFKKMPERNVVSWTAMIAGYAQNGYGEEALNLFQQMQLAGVKPNAQTFTVVLPACANLAALQQGKEVHEIIIKTGFQNNLFVDSALVDMYAKCGSIENAHAVFDKMTQQGIASWNAMILAYATHSCCREALHFFDKMQQSGTNPDQITFIGVLSACCHAGLVDEGWQYFYCMSQYYHITPAIEHYGCMVDLLGRAGHLDEALGFINKMPIKPDATVWGCLLGACRIHANVELGECVAERIFELDSKSAAPYVLLSNIYAAAGRWNDIEKVRKMMKDRGVNKKPGCSWIEVNKQVHAFFTGDRSHLQR